MPRAGVSLLIPDGWEKVSPPPGLASAAASEVRAFLADATWASLGIDVNELSDSQLEQLMKQGVKDIVLLSADTLGDGDNVDVKIQSGPQFHSLAEWRKLMIASAKASKGTPSRFRVLRLCGDREIQALRCLDLPHGGRRQSSPG